MQMRRNQQTEETIASLPFKSAKELNWTLFLLLKSNCYEKWSENMNDVLNKKY